MDVECRVKLSRTIGEVWVLAGLEDQIIFDSAVENSSRESLSCILLQIIAVFTHNQMAFQDCFLRIINFHSGLLLMCLLERNYNPLKPPKHYLLGDLFQRRTTFFAIHL